MYTKVADDMYQFDFKMDGIDVENFSQIIHKQRCLELERMLKVMTAKDTGYLYSYVYTMQGCIAHIQYMDEMFDNIFGGDNEPTLSAEQIEKSKPYYYIPPEEDTVCGS